MILPYGGWRMLYLFLADGFEETEALVPLDLIRRAKISILTVGVGKEYVTGAHGITVKTDIVTDEIDFSQCDGVLLPGGMPGTENLYQCDAVKNAVQFTMQNDKLLAAICAAPIIPGRLGYLQNKKAVCFPGFENELQGRKETADSVVRDGNVITAKGAGCVFPFAHKIISALSSPDTADKVIKEIQYAQM